HGRDGAADVLHGVVDRETARHDAARAVDVDLHVFLGVFALQEEELRDDRVRDVVLDLGAEEDDAIFQQAAEDVPLALAAVRDLGDGRDDVRAELAVRAGADAREAARGGVVHVREAVAFALEELHRLASGLDSSASLGHVLSRLFTPTWRGVEAWFEEASTQ